jgi:hypothetical protein
MKTGCDPAATAPRADTAQAARAPSPAGPRVGIFWCVLDTSGVRHLLADHCALHAAEPYGDCLTFGPGHYEVWQRWQRARAPITPLTPLIRSHEYEEWPRGRVVFDRKADRFFLYADRRIQNADLLPALRALFCLPAHRVIVRADAHYRSPLSISTPPTGALPP